MRLASDRNRFAIDFYPAVDEPMHLNEGMGKTRDVLFNFHDDALEPLDLVHESANLAYPGVVGVPREYYRRAQFADLHLTLEPQRNKYPMVEMKIEHLMSEGASCEKTSRKVTPGLQSFGWRDYGDEKGFRGRFPYFGIYQDMNNEEDYIYCAMIEAWRQGRPFGALPGVRHLMDIDYIDYSSDPARDGAACPHSTNHTDGEVYPSHQWCQGLLYFYLATGDEEALRIARRIGDNLIWWITGPRRESLRFSGRESCWPLLSLAALYDITGEEKYRDAGMIVIESLLAVYEEHGRLVWEYPPGSGILVSYMLPMTVNGIWDMYQVTGDERVLELWRHVTGVLIESLADPDHWGYVQFRNYHLKWPDLTTLARWHYLTGDRKYIDLGRNGLRLFLAGCPQPLLQVESMTAMGYRHLGKLQKLCMAVLNREAFSPE